MKFIICFFYVLTVMLIFSYSAYSQSLIPKDSRIDWSDAGLISPISTSDTIINIKNYKGTDDDKMAQALADVKRLSGITSIYFPADTFTFTKQIELNPGHSNVVFQGAGADSTILKFTHDKCAHCFFIKGDMPFHENKIKRNVLKGTKKIHLPNNSFYKKGDWVHLIEKKNPAAYWKRKGSGGQAECGQICTLYQTDSINVYMKHEASKDYLSAYDLYLYKILPVQNVGFENLKIIRSKDGNGQGTGVTVYFVNAINCWLRGVELSHAFGRHISIRRSAHIEISGCYIHHAFSYDYGKSCTGGEDGFGYGIVLSGSTTNCLIENNIFRKCRHAMLTADGANCNVFTYNYSTEAHSSGCFSILADVCLHGQYSYANLFEHNVVRQIKADDTHGNNGPYNVFLRNQVKAGCFKKSQLTVWHAKQTAVIGCDVFNCYGFWNASGVFKKGKTTWSANRYGCEDKQACFSHQKSGHWFLENIHNLFLSPTEDSYYYTSRPAFLNDVYTFPTLGPTSKRDNGKSIHPTQSIPARDRYFSADTLKTYLPGGQETHCFKN